MIRMNAVIISQNKEERILLAQILQSAGLSISADENLDRFPLRELNEPADLLILAQETAKLQEAVRQARLFSSAPMIVISDFIGDDARVALYEAGADLVLVRPYSPRLLLVQAGMMAQRDISRGLPHPSRRVAGAPVEMFVPAARPIVNAPLYS